MHDIDLIDRSQAPPHDEILRLDDVVRRTGISKTTIYQLIRSGRFPQQRRLGGPGSRSVGWSARELDHYIQVIFSGGQYLAGSENNATANTDVGIEYPRHTDGPVESSSHANDATLSSRHTRRQGGI